VYEGVACYVFPDRKPNTVPLYRLLHRSIEDHFYTTSEDEADNAILRLGYEDEGTACYVYGAEDSGTAYPFYRAARLQDLY
jgi:hypothetical protein